MYITKISIHSISSSGLKMNGLILGCYVTMTTIIWWIYAKMVTEPLRIFYFVGPVWGNLKPEQVCFELTGIDGSWWNKTDDRMTECTQLLSTKFRSFEVTVMCVLYFASMMFVVLYMLCRCCFIQPIMHEIRKLGTIKKEKG